MRMQEFSAPATLDLWQEADGLGGVERALVLAAAAGGGSRDDVAALPLGRRDAHLLSLHRALGGAALEAAAPCPACGEEAEFAVAADALLAHGSAAGAAAPVAVPGVVEWRPPDSRDVLAAAAAGDAAAAEEVLLSRCVQPTELPPAAREAVAEAMAGADPLAEVLVDLACPACGTSFVADVDVAGFVWAELRAHGRRLLREVDTLARAYGWTEAEVLALDARRRAAYLELAHEAAS